MPTPVPTPVSPPLRLQMFPFALPPFDSSKTATDVSWLNDAPAGKHGFVRTRGEHFVDGAGKQLRLWGVNLNFSGVFPEKVEAPKIAARLAKFGFNSARIHHFEGYAAPNGLWKSAAAGSSRIAIPRQFDPQQMDRFDFFMSELMKRGIYINLNLHVGRKVIDGEGIDRPAALPEKDKGVNYFDPRLRELQNQFTRAILTHVNPYTGRAYKDEPGVCAVEVANENSLLGMWLDGSLGKVLPQHSKVLYDRWNDWLQKKYTEVSWRHAWTEIDEPVKEGNLLAGALPFDIINPNSPDAKLAVATQTLQSGWNLATVGGGQGNLNFDRLSGPSIDGFVRPGLTANLQQAGSVSWAFQMNRDGLDLQEGHPYTLSFYARSDTPRQISVNLWQDRQPHRFGGFTAFANLTSDWQKFTFVFRPVTPDPQHSRLSWNLGNKIGVVQFGEIELHEGGRIAAPGDWTLSRGIPLLDFKTTVLWIARRDFAQFLAEVESEHVASQRQLLREIGVKVPVWHTQTQFGGWGGLWRERQSDAIDVHAYWKHPDFGGAGWGGSNWTVGNTSMTSAAGVDPLTGFSLMRVPDKPFVMSEWNSGQPNDYGAESLLMIAAYAAWQDWAAVWIFDYHSAGAYNRNMYEGFFSIDSHPVKMATAPASALLFRRANAGSSPFGSSQAGDVKASDESVSLSLPSDALWLEVASSPGPPTAAPAVRTWTGSGAARTAPLRGKVYVRLEDSVFPATTRASFDNANNFVSDTQQIQWDKKRSVWTVNTPRSKAAIGFWGGNKVLLGEWRLSMPRTENNFAAFALSSMDGQEITSSKKLLLTTAGRAENINMGWNLQRNSVGNNWGSGPTEVEGLTADIEIVSDIPNLQVWALDTTGARRVLVPSRYQNGVLRFSASPDWRTLWYEIGVV
jgi:hypothetical protein